MTELCFKKEVVEKLLLEAGFSDIESSKISCFEEEDFFRTEAFLNKGCSREIFILIGSLGGEMAIHMQSSTNLKILNLRQVILQIEKGGINERDGMTLNAFNSKSIFYEANRKLTQFIQNLKEIIQ
ncbi:hypothetical protein HG452_002060 [Candidatus Saccharibacteria bacterium]|nr:hypothetical protein [Candidatus Saccharibacteria bacterium]